MGSELLWSSGERVEQIRAARNQYAQSHELPVRDLARNPDLLAGSTMQDVSDHGAAAHDFFITRSSDGFAIGGKLTSR